MSIYFGRLLVVILSGIVIEKNHRIYYCRSMRRARDVREQIEGLMIRVEIEMTSNPIDDVAIRKVHISINVVVKIFCHLVMFFTTF